MGIFVGNQDPDIATFNNIIPKIRRSLHYWKQFKLSRIGSARVTSIFHTSPLWYAAKFYPIPKKLQTELQTDIVNYINFPRKQATVSQKEMFKLKGDGGIKLIHIKTKAETSKAKWLLDLTTNNNLRLNKMVYSNLIGIQKGNFDGMDMLYMSTHYHQTVLVSPSPFYKGALIALSKLNIWKTIPDLSEEKVCYNPIFTNEKDNYLPLYSNKQINPTYGQLLTENHKKNTQLHHNKAKVRLLGRITRVNALGNTENILITMDNKRLPFTQITQKLIYEELITLLYLPHHSEVAWFDELQVLGNDWEKIWENIYKNIHNQQTQSTIWEQIHLNFYTTFSYNQWHGDEDNCTLCKDIIPQDIFHIILHCPFVKQIWQEIEPILMKIWPHPVTTNEMAFGIIGNKPKIILRNWITFMLRELIMKEEIITYYNKTNKMDTSIIKHKLNAKIHGEIEQKFLLFVA